MIALFVAGVDPGQAARSDAACVRSGAGAGRWPAGCGWLHYGLLAMMSLTIVATLSAVGIILSIGLLIAPGAIAFLADQAVFADVADCGWRDDASRLCGRLPQLLSSTARPHRRSFWC